MKLQTKEGFKICSKCNEEKPLSDYWKCGGFSFGVYSSCKNCVKKYKKGSSKEQRHKWYRNSYQKNREKIIKKTTQYAKDHPEIRKKTLLKYQYGISLEHYKNIQDSQNGFCAICSKKPSNGILYVDHCHETGRIRGLLCLKCNSLLGFCGDDISILNASIEYIEREKHYGFIS